MIKMIKNYNNKKAFTMIEIVFVIVIIALLASVGIRKFIISKDEAKASTIAKDVVTIRDSIMTYYYANDDSLSKISKVVQYNKNNWNDTNPTKLVFEAHSKECVSIAIVKSGHSENLEINIDENLGGLCDRVKNIGVADFKYELR